VQIHGGKENTVDGNLFLDCRAAISFSPWGEGRWREFTAKALEAPAIDRALYLARWPELSRLGEDHDRNRITRNLAVGCEKLFLRDAGRNVAAANLAETAVDPALAAAARGDFGALEEAMARRGMRPIPFDAIGLYRDGFRRELPEDLLRQARAR